MTVSSTSVRTVAAAMVVALGVGVGLAQVSIEPPAPTRFLDVRGPEMYVYAPENGVFEPLAELGDTVAPGTPAARIHMPETPWLPPVEIAFKAGGIVMCKRIPARTKRGDCLFHLASDLAV